jgi:spermidine synthase
LLVVVSFANARTVFPIAPEPAPLGQVTVIRAAAAAHQIRMVRHYDASSAVGRIEIFGFEQMPGRTEPYPYMFYSQDSSAGSILVRWNGRTRSQLPPGAPGGVVDRLCEESLCGGAYFRARPKVLIIGLGGAPDLVCARYHEAQHIDVVEINPRTIEAVRGPFAHFLGGAPDGPSVHFHLRDGRGFAHGTHGEGYDLVQLSGTDTKQNLATGSLTLSENHLYTVEAFRDYLRSLNDHGVLAFVRFGEPEALRLANTAVVALHELGIRTPVAQHIAIVHDGSIYELMVRRTPFPRFEARRLAQRLTSRTSRSQDSAFTDIFGQRAQKPIELGYVPYGAAQQPFSRFFEDVAVGKVAAFNAAYPYDIRPTTDDWPFFFDLFRHDDLSSWLRAPHLVILRNILVSLVLLSLLLVLIPVLGGRKALRGGGLLAVPLYFGSIGFAYLFVEVWLLSRFAMYLGHQMHGLSVVLSSLLVSSGLGSAMSARLLPRARLRALLAGVLIVLLLVLVAASMSAVTEATWSASLAARVLVSIAFIAPLGFCMGFPMPAGLAWSGAAYPNSIALCVGINGFGSVIATIAVLPLSLWFGYSGVLAIGGCLYALSSLLALGWRGGPPVDGVPVGKRPLAPAAAAK